MPTEPDPNATPSPARETHSINAQPTTQKPALKRKRASRKTPAQRELAEASLAVKVALEREAQARRKVEREARQFRAKKGHDCVAALVARLDPSVREMVLSNLLGIAKLEEADNVQEWVASLVPVK